ncbi:MAG: galactokinase [Akkermansiaceae bacterium]
MLDQNKALSDLAQDARDSLKTNFNVDSTFVAVAPGRVNLIGEHIDYCDGFVLPLAIARYVVIAARPNDLQIARITTTDETAVEINLSEEQQIAEPKWSNYLRGIIREFQNLHYNLPGFDAAIVSSVPLGAGLSSSAALECAFATLLEGLVDTVLPTAEKALLAQKAEHDFAGVPCGIMDQFASAFGMEDQLILIDCRSGEPEMVPFADPSLSIIVANTNVSHDLSDGGYGARRKDTEDGLALIGKTSWRDVTMDDVYAVQEKMGDRIFRRSRHVVTEIARTVEAVEAFKSSDFSNIGSLMEGSHRSLRDDFEVSCDELNLMVALAKEIGFEGGVLGARMTGGGFGGSTVTLCRSVDAEAIAKQMHERYKAQTGIEPLLFITRPSTGAHLL